MEIGNWTSIKSRPLNINMESFTYEHVMYEDGLSSDAEREVNGLNTTSFYDDNDDELDVAEIEAMLYSRIYFEQTDMEPQTSSPALVVTASHPKIYLEEEAKSLPKKLQHTTSVSTMLNFSGRSFMSPECKEDLRKSSCLESSPVTAGGTVTVQIDVSAELVGINKKEKFDSPVLVTSSSSDDVIDITPDFMVEKVKNHDKNAARKPKQKEQILVLSDSDFEVEKKKSNNCKKSKKRSKEISDREVPAFKKAKPAKFIMLDSSDSEDSLVVLGDSGVFNDSQDIQTNILGQTSVDHKNISAVSTTKSDHSNVKFQEWDGKPALNIRQVLSLLKPGSWHICDDDKYGIKNSRYYSKEKVVRCRICNDRGHVERNCTRKNPACILCGERGHGQRACPSSLCYNCSMPGHNARDCDQPRRSHRVTCRRCHAVGHMQHECPELWRQFHLTTSTGRLVSNNSKENRHPYCYNCGEYGHFGYNCEEEGVTYFWNPMQPFITYYDNLAPKEKHVPKKFSIHAKDVAPRRHEIPNTSFVEKCAKKLEKSEREERRKQKKLDKKAAKLAARKAKAKRTFLNSSSKKGSMDKSYSEQSQTAWSAQETLKSLKLKPKKKKKKDKSQKVLKSFKGSGSLSEKTIFDTPIIASGSVSQNTIFDSPMVSNDSSRTAMETFPVNIKANRSNNNARERFHEKTIFDKEVENFPRNKDSPSKNKKRKKSKQKKRNSPISNRGFNVNLNVQRIY